jgi:hypothetical protein
VPYDTQVSEEAGRIVRRLHRKSKPVLLRGLDVIHLASAVVVGADTVVAADQRLRVAAKAVGLKAKP